MNINVDGIEYNTKTKPISSEAFYKAMQEDKKVSTSLVNEYDAMFGAFGSEGIMQHFIIVIITEDRQQKADKYQPI